MNINDMMAAAIQNPELIIELKHKRNELTEKLNKNGNVLSESEKEHTRKAIAALDQFIWAVDTSDDPAAIKVLGQMFKEAKKWQIPESIQMMRLQISASLIHRRKSCHFS